MSDPATLPEQPPVRIWRRVCIALGVLVVGMVVAGFVSTSLEQHRNEKAFRAIEEALDRDDPNWHLDDLEANRETIPEGENSAPVIMAAVRLIPKGWPGEALAKLIDARTLHPVEQLDAEQIDELEKGLPAVAASLVHARRVADLPRGRHRLTHAFNPILTLLPDQSETRQLGNVLRAEGLLQIQQGDLDGALRTCRACINAGRSLGDEPFMVSQLHRIACIAIGCNLAERALAQGKASEKELARLQELLELEDGHETFRLAVRGERAANYDLLGKLARREINTSEMHQMLGIAQEPFFIRWTTKDVTRRDQIESLALMNELVETTRLPEAGRPAAERAIDDRLKKQRPTGKVWVVLAPAYHKVGEACRRKTEQVRTLLVLVAIERYRLKHGKWPLKLDDLKPNHLKSIPLDPYDGKPLRFVHQPDGAIVYSVGHDAADHGGNLDRQRSNAAGFDQGYQLWDVRERRKPAPPKVANNP